MLTTDIKSVMKYCPAIISEMRRDQHKAHDSGQKGKTQVVFTLGQFRTNAWHLMLCQQKEATRRGNSRDRTPSQHHALSLKVDARMQSRQLSDAGLGLSNSGPTGGALSDKRLTRRCDLKSKVWASMTPIYGAISGWTRVCSFLKEHSKPLPIKRQTLKQI